MATKKNVASPEDEGLSTGTPAPEEAPTKEGEAPAPEEAPTKEGEVPAPEEAPTKEGGVPAPEEAPTEEAEAPAPIEEHVEGTDTPEATPVAEERGAAEAEDNHEDTIPTDEEMPPTALSELARQILRDHDLRVVFLVSDGTAFYTYSDALNYAQTLTDRQVQYFFATPPTDEDLRELLPPALRPNHLQD